MTGSHGAVPAALLLRADSGASADELIAMVWGQSVASGGWCRRRPRLGSG